MIEWAIAAAYLLTWPAAAALGWVIGELVGVLRTWCRGGR